MKKTLILFATLVILSLTGRLAIAQDADTKDETYWVTQEPRPFLYFDDEDLQVIVEDLFPAFLGMA